MNTLKINKKIGLDKGWDYAVLLALFSEESRLAIDKCSLKNGQANVGFAPISVEWVFSRTGFPYQKQLKLIKELESDGLITIKKVGIPPVRYITVF